MIRMDNLTALRDKFPEVLKFMQQLENRMELSHITSVSTRTGTATIQIEETDRTFYLHSKFDPIREAKQWIKSYEQRLVEAEHVFVYGIGCGYHIEELLQQFPNKLVTLYEPSPQIFYNALCNQKLSFLKSKKVKNLFVEYVPGALQISLNSFLRELKEEVYLFLHPVYERMFSEQTDHFLKAFKDLVFNYREQRATVEAYEHLWTLNSLGNFVKVIETPNVFHLNKELFRDKPVILAAAGPSLQEEIENLRYIKEQKLAYIFSVGSANKALLANGIKPDAVMTYDPNTYNHLVFEKLIELGIDDIPMIFGSSVGYQILFEYQGPKLHMITNQDKISPYLMQEEQLQQRQEIIHDAPTITILTLEMAFKLGCNPIILAGQNFGYKNNQYYSQGISYSYRPTELQEGELAGLLEVEGADGGLIKTTASHNTGRIQMEQYLSLWDNLTVINTTKGGAKIKGTTFIPLDEVINDRLKEPVVIPNWHLQTYRNYDLTSVKKRAELLHEEYRQFPKVFEFVEKDIKKLNTLMNYNESAQIKRMFPKLDNHMKDFLRNGYFDTIIRPMMASQFEHLNKELTEIRIMSDSIDKAERVVNTFGGFLYRAHEIFLKVNPVYSHLHQAILLTESKIDSNLV